MTSARVNFYRCGSWRESARSYRVWVDGRPVGHLRPEGALSVEVEPGAHRVRVRSRWLSGGEGTVDADAAEPLWVLVEPSAGGGRGRLALPTRWLALVVDRPSRADRPDSERPLRRD